MRTKMSVHMNPDSGVPDPYRIFFPLGILAGLVGVGIWPAYSFGWIDTIPSIWHIDLQLQGFLFAFVLGFLLTALPRFSLTWHATWPELIFFSSVFLLGNIATAFGFYEFGRIAFFINVLALIVYGVRRFARRKSDPPPEFVFVGAGLLFGFVSSCLRLFSLQFETLATADIAGRRLLTEGMMLLLVLGIGGKLAPMFFGFSGGSPIIPQIGGKSPMSRKQMALIGVAVALTASFFVEHFYSERLALWIRAALTSFVFLGVMKIHRKPLTSGVLVNVLRFSCWAIFLSLWGSAIHPVYRVEVLHVMFIGGFGAMILSIATRVTLSHGNYSLDLERRSVPLALAAVSLGLATVIRATAALFPMAYFQFLGAAGIFWAVGLILWGASFSWRALIKR